MFRKIFLLISVSLLCVVGVFSQATSTSTTATTDASSTDKPKKPAFRSTKDQVTEAQTMLKAKKMFSGEVTGVSSSEWKTAVKSYQGENGLTKTGSLNRATLEKMGIALTDKQKLIPVSPRSIASTSSDDKAVKMPDKPATASTAGTDTKSTSNGPKKPAPFQANKDQIMTLQKTLKDAKLYSGDQTGERSDELKESIKKYQTANGLKSTGGINAVTLDKMGIALTDAQKANVAAQTAYDAGKTPKN